MMGGSGSGRPKKPFLETYKGQSKNTCTRYIKDAGMVCAEAMKRDRRNPANKYVKEGGCSVGSKLCGG